MKINKIGLVHTVDVLIDPLEELFEKNIPDVDLVNFVDESTLNEVMEKGKLTPGAIRRTCRLILSAQDSGVDMVLFTCSSLSPAVDVARELTDIPVKKIDRPMAEKAVSAGDQIGVLATVGTTIDPTSNLIKTVAREQGKEVSISTNVSEDAFSELMNGTQDRHDEILIQNIKQLSDKVDAIVLAQGSMARLLPELDLDKETPVLTSPNLAVEALAKEIN